MLAMTGARAQDAAFDFNLPAQPLSAALAGISRTAGIQVIAAENVVAERTAPAIAGRMTARAALDRALAGSGLEARSGQGGTFLVQRAVAPGEQQLQEVKVRETPPLIAPAPPPFAGGEVSRGARIGIFGNRDLFETPLSTKSFTEQAIQDRQALTSNDLLRADASVNPINNPAVAGSDGVFIRGFRSFVFESSFDGSTNIMGRRFPLEMVERVDIIKGPASFHSGVRFFGGVGGTVNYESKKPLSAPLTRFNALYGVRSQVGGHLDLSRRFGEGDAWGIRINAAARDGETANPGVDEQNRVLHVALNYTGERLRFDGQAGYVFGRVDGTSFGYNFAAGVPALAPPKNREFRGPAWAFSEYEYQIARGKLEFDLTRDWTVGTSLQASSYTEDFLNLNGPVVDVAGNARPEVYPQFGKADWGDLWSTDVFLKGRFRTGSVSHRVTLAYSYAKFRERFNDPAVVSPVGVQPWNIYNPTTLGTIPAPSLAFNGTEYLFFDNRGAGVALLDEMSFLDDRLLVTPGVRWNRTAQDFFGNNSSANPNTPPTAAYDESKVSPALGVLYKLTPALSVYANYLEAIERGGVAPNTAVNRGASAPPGIAEQIEAGVKVDTGRVGYTAAIFEISRPSAFVDPGTNTFGLFGEQVHRGLELDVFGTPIRGVRVYGSYAYLDAQLTKTAGGLQDGKRPPAVPRHVFVAGGEVDVPGVPGLALNALLRYTGDTAYDANNTRFVPSYTTVDLGARYALRAGGKVPLVLRLNVFNLFDEDYYQSGTFFLQQGAPRTVRVTLQADF